MRAYAAITGSLMLLSSAELALAADWYTGASAPVQKDDWFVAIDTSGSVTSTGSAFGRIAATGSVANPLALSGPRYRIEGGGGTFTYTSGAGDQVNGTQMYGSFLGGYERVWNRGSVAGYLGVDARNTNLSVADPANTTAGTSVGIKAVAEFYMKPWDHTMISGMMSYATNHSSFFLNLRGGYEVFGFGHVGPDLTVLSDASFKQMRVGAFYSSPKIYGVQFGAATGVLTDSRTQGGVYGTLSARFGF